MIESGEASRDKQRAGSERTEPLPMVFVETVSWLCSLFFWLNSIRGQIAVKLGACVFGGVGEWMGRRTQKAVPVTGPRSDTKTTSDPAYTGAAQHSCLLVCPSVSRPQPVRQGGSPPASPACLTTTSCQGIRPARGCKPACLVSLCCSDTLSVFTPSKDRFKLTYEPKEGFHCHNRPNQTCL